MNKRLALGLTSNYMWVYGSTGSVLDKILLISEIALLAISLGLGLGLKLR